VVIDDLYIRGPPGRPAEADPELIVYPDAVLAGSVAAQGLETIPGRNPQVIQPAGLVEHGKLAHCHRLDVGQPGNPVAAIQGFGIPAAE
jgi:hypothetical protein